MARTAERERDDADGERDTRNGRRAGARATAAVMATMMHENDSVCGFLPVAGERSKERVRIVLHAHKRANTTVVESTGPDGDGPRPPPPTAHSAAQ